MVVRFLGVSQIFFSDFFLRSCFASATTLETIITFYRAQSLRHTMLHTNNVLHRRVNSFPLAKKTTELNSQHPAFVKPPENIFMSLLCEEQRDCNCTSAGKISFLFVCFKASSLSLSICCFFSDFDRARPSNVIKKYIFFSTSSRQMLRTEREISLELLCVLLFVCFFSVLLHRHCNGKADNGQQQWKEIQLKANTLTFKSSRK